MSNGSVSRDSKRWNHNIHYHPVIIRAVPARARALDVGCGEGMLARELSRRGCHVTAIDCDERSIQLARKQSADTDVECILGDFLAYPFEPESFGAIVSVATLHHMDMASALDRMRALLKPGGTIAIVGLARSEPPWDIAYQGLGAVCSQVHKLTKDHWESMAPTVWPPPVTFSEARRISRERLPGSRFRRHVLWRYTLTWTKP